jgi:ubiquinone/menaquinone biosynthesis C-methylase UbiE
MLKGRVEGFDGRLLTGWVEGSAGVDVYLDDMLAEITPNYEINSESNARTFELDLARLHSFAETPNIVVKFARTNIELEVAPTVVGIVNQVDFSPVDHDVSAYVSRIVDLPTPPQEYIDYVGGGGPRDFIATGTQIFADLLYYGMLEPRPLTIVDLGCGCGRVALAVGPHLNPDDRYVGFDTWSPGISWAQQNVTTRYPNLEFRAFPDTDQGHREGYKADSVFPTELPDSSVDSVMALSLFTHLRMPAAAGYLREIFRILKPGGRAFVTFFICEPGNPWILQNLAVTEQNDDGYFVVDDTYVDAYLFESRLKQVIENVGFRIALKKYGVWGEHPRTRFSREGQDLIIAVKP